MRSNILLTAKAQLEGSNTVSAGTSEGICRVELIFTIMSSLSLNGGQASVGNLLKESEP